MAFLRRFFLPGLLAFFLFPEKGRGSFQEAHRYRTEWVHYFYSESLKKEDEDRYRKRGIAPEHLEKNLYHLRQYNAKYSCQGDSFLAGFWSQHQDGDQRFSFICRYLKNSKGTVEKHACNDFKAMGEQTPDKEWSSSCKKEELLGGLASMRKGDGRIHREQCCTAKLQGKILKKGTCKWHSDLRASGKNPWVFTCPATQILGGLRLRKAQKDGTELLLEAQCCPLSQ